MASPRSVTTPLLQTSPTLQVVAAVSAPTVNSVGSMPRGKTTDSACLSSDITNLQVAAAAPAPTVDSECSTPGGMTTDSERRSSDIGGHTLLPDGIENKHYPTGKACTQRDFAFVQDQVRISSPDDTPKDPVMYMPPDPQARQWTLHENGDNQLAGMCTPVGRHSPLLERGKCCVQETVVSKGKEILILNNPRDQQRSDKVRPFFAIYTPTTLPTQHPETLMKGITDPNVSSTHRTPK